MFAYCGNNPVNRLDYNGLLWSELRNWLEEAWKDVTELASGMFGAGRTSSILHESETPIIPDPSPITVTQGTHTKKTIASHGNSSKPISVYMDNVLNAPIKSSSAGLCFNIGSFALDIGLAFDDLGINGAFNNGNTTHSFGLTADVTRVKIGFEYSTAISSDNMTTTNYTNISVNGWCLVALYLYLTTGQYTPSPQALPSPMGK